MNVHIITKLGNTLSNFTLILFWGNYGYPGTVHLRDFQNLRIRYHTFARFLNTFVRVRLCDNVQHEHYGPDLIGTAGNISKARPCNLQNFKS